MKNPYNVLSLFGNMNQNREFNRNDLNSFLMRKQNIRNSQTHRFFDRLATVTRWFLHPSKLHRVDIYQLVYVIQNKRWLFFFIDKQWNLLTEHTANKKKIDYHPVIILICVYFSWWTSCTIIYKKLFYSLSATIWASIVVQFSCGWNNEQLQ